MVAAGPKVVIAPDSFKECLSAQAVATAMAAGIARAWPAARLVAVPMADGGEGTLAAALAGGQGRRITRVVTGPLGVPVEAESGWLDDATAVIEAAAANGLHLVPRARRDPTLTTTRGVGELLAAALAAGARKVVLTVGGSATVDGGAGLAQALGYQLLDDQGEPLGEGGGGLLRLARIVPPASRPWDGVAIEVACDVDNPLIGEAGAARIFGPQKGATEAQVELLEAGLARLAAVAARDLGVEMAALPGAGAAGGLSAGLVAFAGARLVSGVELVMELVGLRAAIQGAALVITGEGRTDRQTLRGKVCAGVAAAAREAGATCVVVSGSVTASQVELATLGIAGAFSLCRGPIGLDEAMANAAALIEETAANVAGLYRAARQG